LLSVSQPVPGWISWVATPSISADGGSVGFQTWTPGWVSNDINRAGDTFTAMVDRDSDLIPDWWMLQFFGHPTGQSGDHSRAQDDFDADGMTNLQEFLAGTDPTNANSVLRIEVSFVVATNGVVLNWPASPSRFYRLQFKNDPRDAVWSDADGTPVFVAGREYLT